jgi:hypothetical protein
MLSMLHRTESARASRALRERKEKIRSKFISLPFVVHAGAVTRPTLIVIVTVE